MGKSGKAEVGAPPGRRLGEVAGGGGTSRTESGGESSTDTDDNTSRRPRRRSRLMSQLGTRRRPAYSRGL
jgi:hypothetical protein